MRDYSEQFQASILQALENNEPVVIKGGGSKDFYGREIVGTPLLTANHQGIINYEPQELVVTARCGTLLSDLEAELAKNGQMLASEPLYFTSNATLGGLVACGFSGPRRPYSGSLRDFVLGTRIINGHGEILRFGGEVMKNVAGYDVSRLMVGALGTLGLLLDISLKVLPKPELEITKAIECKQAGEAIRLMNKWSGSKLPISAACYDGVNVYFRLSGTASSVVTSSKRLAGEVLDEGVKFWHSIAEQNHGFFNNSKDLWRISIASDAPQIKLSGKQLIDWGGSQRWFVSDNDEQNIRQIVESQGGQVTLFRGSDTGRKGDVFHPLTPPVAALHQRIKTAFDPQGIFNPGRLYREM